MKKQSIKILVSIIGSLVFLSVLGFVVYQIGSYIYMENKFDRMLDSIEPQGEIPCYAYYSTIYDGEYVCDVEEKIEEQLFAINSCDIFAKVNDRYYYVFDVPEESGVTVYIASHKQNEDIKINHSVKFKDVSYYSSLADPVEKRNSFYNNGIIYLTDFNKVVKYDISEDKAVEIQYSEFVYPDVYSVKVADHQSVSIYNSADECIKTFDLEDLSSQNKEISKVYELRDHKTSSGLWLLYDFFSYATCYDNNKVYLVYSVRSFRGHSNTLVIEYDIKNDICKYLGYKELKPGNFYVLAQR